MQVAKDYRTIIQKSITFVYQTMDYWLPGLLFLTIPLWLLPAISAYLSWKLYCICKCFLKIGNDLMSSCSTIEHSYAVLKGNGRYLREDCADTLKKQFYDYTSRRFMSIGEFQPNTKIVQLECYNETGLSFFRETIQQENIKGLQSNQNKLKKTTSSLSLINKTNYQIHGQPENYDCALLFDFKRKSSTYSPDTKVDLLRIISFCRFHLLDSGYMVYGDYFEQGQISTYIQLFNSFNLKVVDQEDVTKNIQYAAKIEAKQKISFEKKFYDVFMAQIGSFVGWKKYQDGKRFIVLILEKV